MEITAFILTLSITVEWSQVMKALLASVGAILALVSTTFAETKWVDDNAHTQVRFTVVYMLVTEVSGSFKDFTVKVSQPNEDFRSAQIEATIQTASVNTENDKRDNHLRSDDFFNAEKFPEMKFVSVSFEKIDENRYKIAGNLTIRDVTRPLELDAVYGGTVTDPRGNTKAGFKATGTINRQDFGVKWNKALDGGGFVVSDEVEIVLDVQLKMVKDGTL
jgi:polyisoprenoid-binding protein YceI